MQFFRSTMSPVVLFILACLGPLSVMCGKVAPFPPAHIPYPAQQCKERLPASDGECFGTPHSAIGVPEIGENPCRSLKCAVPDGEGGYARVSVARPRIGTICGLFKACNAQRKCVDIDLHEIPLQTGYSQKRWCYITKKPAMYG